MALTGTEKDELAELLNQDKTDRRLDNWLWLFLSANGMSEEVKKNGPGNKGWIANVLTQDVAMKNEILSRKDKTFLPEEYLKWITRDARQNDWLVKHICGVFLKLFPDIPPFLIGRERVIALIDYGEVDLDLKIRRVESANAAWSFYLEKDRIFDWFKREDEEARCNFSWDWIKRNNTFSTWGQSSFCNHQELLLFFDQAPLSEEAKILMVEKIKKAWNQKKYRENLKGKKQCNLVLSNESIKLLDQLGKKYDLTRAELIEVLIKMEAKNETYLTEKLQRRQALLS
jgi:hypothetical protein